MASLRQRGTTLSTTDFAALGWVGVCAYLYGGQHAQIACHLVSVLPPAVFSYLLIIDRKTTHESVRSLLCFWILQCMLLCLDTMMGDVKGFYFGKFLVLSGMFWKALKDNNYGYGNSDESITLSDRSPPGEPNVLTEQLSETSDDECPTNSTQDSTLLAGSDKHADYEALKKDILDTLRDEVVEVVEGLKGVEKEMRVPAVDTRQKKDDAARGWAAAHLPKFVSFLHAIFSVPPLPVLPPEATKSAREEYMKEIDWWKEKTHKMFGLLQTYFHGVAEDYMNTTGRMRPFNIKQHELEPFPVLNQPDAEFSLFSQQIIEWATSSAETIEGMKRDIEELLKRVARVEEETEETGRGEEE